MPLEGTYTVGSGLDRAPHARDDRVAMVSTYQLHPALSPLMPTGPMVLREVEIARRAGFCSFAISCKVEIGEIRRVSAQACPGRQQTRKPPAWIGYVAVATLQSCRGLAAALCRSAGAASTPTGSTR